MMIGMRKFRPILWMALTTSLATILAVGLFMYFRVSSGESSGFVGKSLIPRPKMERQELPDLLGEMRISSELLEQEYFNVEKNGKSFQVKFTLDKELQARIETVYQNYDPAYAAFVAMDPETGKILALVDHTNDKGRTNLALKATYPAASTFKIVTSTAALDAGKIQPSSLVPVNGSNTTLYKRNLRDVVTRWTRFMSIEEAFAKSVNTVFAKIALNRVGQNSLQKYANAFGYNQKISFDLPINMGTALIPNDEYGLAESGSGYTIKQTLNPVQGAMIASTVVNGGNLPEPYIVDHVNSGLGVPLYRANPRIISHPMDHETAHSLSLIMEHTVTSGTVRKEFRDYNRHPVLSNLFIGGKTGSLSGTNPQGKYDWFIGFAQSSKDPSKKVAFASLVVNQKFWRVKASHVAREAILQYFSPSKNKALLVRNFSRK